MGFRSSRLQRRTIFRFDFEPSYLDPWPPDLAKSTRLYKHLPRRFATALLQDGVVRIGTVSSFRQYEAADRARSDNSECLYTQVVGHYSADIHGPIEQYLLPRVRPAVIAEVGSGMLDIDIQYWVPDAYLFCMSTSRSRKVSQLFEGCDTCVWIKEPLKFLTLIGDTLNAQIPLMSTAPNLGECDYRERVAPYQSPKPRAIEFIKEPRYAKQCEARAFWWLRSPNAVIEPLIIRNMGLRSCCEAISLKK